MINVVPFPVRTATAAADRPNEQIAQTAAAVAAKDGGDWNLLIIIIKLKCGQIVVLVQSGPVRFGRPSEPE